MQGGNSAEKTPLLPQGGSLTVLLGERNGDLVYNGKHPTRALLVFPDTFLEDAMKYMPQYLKDVALNAMGSEQNARLQQVRGENRLDIFPQPHLRLAAFDALQGQLPRVIVVGQDPYFQRGKATGLAFEIATQYEWKESDSLLELNKLMGRKKRSKSLSPLACQGILWLNASLTVEEKYPGSDCAIWNGWIQNFVRSWVKKSIENDWPSPIVVVMNKKEWSAWLSDEIPESVKSCLILRGHPTRGFWKRCGLPAGEPTEADTVLKPIGPSGEVDRRLAMMGRNPIDWSL